MTFLDVSQGAVLIKYTPRHPSPVSLLCNTYSDPLAATSYPKTLTPHPPSASSSLGLEFIPMPALKPAATVLSSTTHAKKKKKKWKKSDPKNHPFNAWVNTWPLTQSYGAYTITGLAAYTKCSCVIVCRNYLNMCNHVSFLLITVVFVKSLLSCKKKMLTHSFLCMRFRFVHLCICVCELQLCVLWVFETLTATGTAAIDWLHNLVCSLC